MSKMKLRAKSLAIIEAPALENIALPPDREPGSIDFLALPQEIRILVYGLLLKSENDISVNHGMGYYYVLNYADGEPTLKLATAPAVSTCFTFGLVRTLDPNAPTVKIQEPVGFSRPAKQNPLIEYLEPHGTPPEADNVLASDVKNCIPLANVFQSAGLSMLPVTHSPTPHIGVYLPSKNLARYIGPICYPEYAYLPICRPASFSSTNVRILRTCKTVYAETLPILYAKNKFVLHNARGWRLSSIYGHKGLGGLYGLCGRSLARLTRLRLAIKSLGDILYGGSKSIMSVVLRGCSSLQELTLAVADGGIGKDTVMQTLVHIATNVADVRKGTGEPKVTAKLKMFPPEQFALSASTYTGVSPWTIMGKKTNERMPLSRQFTVEVMGVISQPDLDVMQTYKRKGWGFNRKSPEDDSEIRPDTWVELEWVKSKA